MCPVTIHYSLSFITDQAHPLRGVAFLVSSDKKVLAKSAFERLREKEKNWLRVYFDNWRDGLNNKKHYHGWNKSEFKGKYTKCFVFKGQENQSQFRLYGFLVHPKENDKRYELCVLVHAAQKKGFKTHEPDLIKTENIRINPSVREAIQNYFGE